MKIPYLLPLLILPTFAFAHGDIDKFVLMQHSVEQAITTYQTDAVAAGDARMNSDFWAASAALVPYNENDPHSELYVRVIFTLADKKTTFPYHCEHQDMSMLGTPPSTDQPGDHHHDVTVVCKKGKTP